MGAVTQGLAPTIGVKEAAQLLRLSEDALMRKTRAGKVPGAKIGRQWVFVQADLLELIREQAKVRACRSIPAFRAPSGSDSQSVVSRLDARMARLTRESRGSQLARQIEKERRDLEQRQRTARQKKRAVASSPRAR